MESRLISLAKQYFLNHYGLKNMNFNRLQHDKEMFNLCSEIDAAINDIIGGIPVGTGNTITTSPTPKPTTNINIGDLYITNSGVEVWNGTSWIALPFPINTVTNFPIVKPVSGTQIGDVYIGENTTEIWDGVSWIMLPVANSCPTTEILLKNTSAFILKNSDESECKLATPVEDILVDNDKILAYRKDETPNLPVGEYVGWSFPELVSWNNLPSFTPNTWQGSINAFTNSLPQVGTLPNNTYNKLQNILDVFNNILINQGSPFRLVSVGNDRIFVADSNKNILQSGDPFFTANNYTLIELTIENWSLSDFIIKGQTAANIVITTEIIPNDKLVWATPIYELPIPIITMSFNNEIQHIKRSSLPNGGDVNLLTTLPHPKSSIPDGRGVTIRFEGSSDPNNMVTFIPDYPKEEGVKYIERNNNSGTVYKYDKITDTYIAFTGVFTYDELVNTQKAWLGVYYDKDVHEDFFLNNTPMLFLEIRDSRNPKRTNKGRFNKWKKLAHFNKSSNTFINLNRPNNVKETPTNGFNNGLRGLETQFNFIPNTKNNIMMFNINMFSLFGSGGITPSFNFPVSYLDWTTDMQKYSPRYNNLRGVLTAGLKTSWGQLIRFRFGILDPRDNRNIIYSEPSKEYEIKPKGGYFETTDDHYFYQFVIKEVK